MSQDHDAKEPTLNHHIEHASVDMHDDATLTVPPQGCEETRTSILERRDLDDNETSIHMPRASDQVHDDTVLTTYGGLDDQILRSTDFAVVQVQELDMMMLDHTDGNLLKQARQEQKGQFTFSDMKH